MRGHQRSVPLAPKIECPEIHRYPTVTVHPRQCIASQSEARRRLGRPTLQTRAAVGRHPQLRLSQPTLRRSSKLHSERMSASVSPCFDRSMSTPKLPCATDRYWPVPPVAGPRQPAPKRTTVTVKYWPTCVPEACYLVGQRAGGTPPTAKCSIPACRRRRPNSGARPKAEDRVTLPPRNVSLAEWLNSGKENGSDEVNEGAVHAGVQARGGADGQGRPEPGSRVEGARDQQTSADSLKS